MAKRKFKPQPNQAPPQQQVQVDLSQAETMKCEHCGNVVFIKIICNCKTNWTRGNCTD